MKVHRTVAGHNAGKTFVHFDNLHPFMTYRPMVHSTDMDSDEGPIDAQFITNDKGEIVPDQITRIAPFRRKDPQ